MRVIIIMRVRQTKRALNFYNYNNGNIHNQTDYILI